MRRTGTAGRIAVILLAAMILLTGCGSSGTKAPDAAATASVSEPAGSETEMPGDGQGETYASASELLEKAERGSSCSDYAAAFELFSSIDGYGDSHEMAVKCCDGYILAYFGGRKYMRPTGLLSLPDDLLRQLNRMRGYGDADDFASLAELLKAGDYPGVVRLVVEDPLCCGKFRTEAGNLLWDEVKQVSRLLTTKTSGYQAELDHTLALAWAAGRLTAAPGPEAGESSGNLFAGSTDSVSDVFVSGSVYEGILALCGTDPAGKVLVTRVLHPYAYSAGVALAQETEYCLSFTAMESLPAKVFPASFSEIGYLIECESKYQFAGKYDSGTQAVRESVTVRLLKLPENEVLGETVVYGPEPEENIEYTGKAPAYRSGGEPSAEEVSAAVLRFCETAAGAE